jgi:hypothetical protein
MNISLTFNNSLSRFRVWEDRDSLAGPLLPSCDGARDVLAFLVGI